jgi:para-aminobenzoate synthetase component 1
MTKIEFIKKMNYFGSIRQAFLFVIDYEFYNPLIFELKDINSSEIKFQTEILSNYSKTFDEKPKFEFSKNPVKFYEYSAAFEHVKNNILNGNSYLLNLTFPTEISSNLNIEDIYNYSNAKYKLWIKDKFVCFSPEIFVKINNNIISSYPMKGTIDADLPNALEIILNDEKEFAEHNTIVDLIRNDLSIISDNVRVTKFRYPDYLQTNNKNLIQISSEICGDLPVDYHNNIGDIIAGLLPAGSVTGAPKAKTLEIISQAENYKRGYYTGVFGVFDGKNLDSAVLIRFIEQNEKRLIFKSGGGITSMSDVNSEFQELIDKVYVPIY